MADSSSSPLRWLTCGAVAGLVVDLTLYPLDTMKTRLQSRAGFRAAGGFRSLYSGMASVAIGSAPGAAVFFLAYQKIGAAIGRHDSLSHAMAASFGEVSACIIRVPTELLKQRAQADSSQRLSAILGDILKKDGFTGLFRGYGSTVAREIPFSVIQFPLWEALKRRAARAAGTRECSPLAGAACGSVAGGFSAAITTPLDTVKTRIMLSKQQKSTSIVRTARDVYAEGGLKRMYAGALPRTLWMSIGGFIFFGAFEGAKMVTSRW